MARSMADGSTVIGMTSPIVPTLYSGTAPVGPYVQGRRHGHWMEVLCHGGSYGLTEGQGDGPYMDGKQHGLWRDTTIRTVHSMGETDRRTSEVPYVDGMQYGEEVTRFEDGRVMRTQWDRGKAYYKGKQIWPPVR